jgi:hypothetical protein
MRKVWRLLPDGSLVSGLQRRGCDRAGGVYTAVAQNAKKEILGLLPFYYLMCGGQAEGM